MVLEQLRDGQDPFHPPISRPTIRFAAPAPRPRRQTVESASVDIAAIIEAIIAALRGVHDRPRIPAGWMVAVDSDKQWLGFTSGHQRVVVYADRIEAGRGDQDEIEVMLELARLRGWQTLALTGDPQFRLDAMIAATRKGFSISVQSAEDEELLRRARPWIEPVAPRIHDVAPVAPRPRRPSPR